MRYEPPSNPSATTAQRPRYTPAEELANSLTHGTGALLSVIGLLVLMNAAGERADPLYRWGMAVFGAAMIFMYAVSTLYHGVRNPRWKQTLRLLDHAAIFVLIAGTYTPFTLINLRGPWGWWLFGTIWILAIAGVALELSPLRRWRIVMILLYVAMGWLVLVAVEPMLNAVAPGGLILLLLGGLAYTVGIGFYAWRRLPFHHAIWHLFVLTGTALHYFAVLYFVRPVAAG